MQQFLEGDTKRPEVFVLLKVERDAQHVQLRRSLGWVLMAFQEFPWTQHDLSCAVDLLTWKLSLRWWQLDQELDPLEAGGKMERSHQDGGFLKWYPKSVKIRTPPDNSENSLCFSSRLFQTLTECASKKRMAVAAQRFAAAELDIFT